MVKKMSKNWLICLILVLFAGILLIPSLFPSFGKSQTTASTENTSGREPAPASAAAPVLTVPSGVPILMYHSISDEKNNDAVVSRERFAEQMAYLFDQKFTPISMEQLYAYVSKGQPLPPKPVVITFDDGYLDTYEIAMPILQRYKFKSVVFIPPTDVAQRLTWKQIQEMKSSGMEIASHSLTHRDMETLSPVQQAEEIQKAQEILDRILNQNTRYFCYPYGGYNSDTIRLLKEKGYLLAVTMNPGWAKQGDDPLTLRRIWIGNSVDLKNFHERITRENYPML